MKGKIIIGLMQGGAKQRLPSGWAAGLDLNRLRGVFRESVGTTASGWNDADVGLSDFYTDPISPRIIYLPTILRIKILARFAKYSISILKVFFFVSSGTRFAISERRW